MIGVIAGRPHVKFCVVGSTAAAHNRKQTSFDVYLFTAVWKQKKSLTKSCRRKLANRYDKIR